MSTTFQIIPVETKSITFDDVIKLSEKRLNAFLNSYGLDSRFRLKISLHENSEKYVKEIDLDSGFEWKDSEYVWFNVIGIPGGTNAYCEEIKSEFEESDPWWRLEDMISNNKTIEDFEQKIEKAKNLNVYWTFRRSAGQPATITLTYGLISAAIAELTGGFIWTDDGAWNFEKFPAEPNEFYKWYFKPQLEDHYDSKEWAERCLEGIKKEIKSC